MPHHVPPARFSWQPPLISTLVVAHTHHVGARAPVAGQRAIVITLGRDGEDNAAYRLGDVDLTLRGFAGTDAELMQVGEGHW